MRTLAARPSFAAAATPPAILAVVVLVELVLFVGYHAERWRKALAPLRRPAVAAGEGLVIRSDGHGYYAWLRSLLVDGDCSFDNEFDEHNPLGDWVPPATPRTRRGLRPNRWSVGPACLWSLTVVPAHRAFGALRPLGWPWTTQGYELPYQLLVGLTTLLFSVAGLGFLYAICREYAPPARAALAAALLTLGTTIVFYSAIEVAMAHGPGAAAVAALVYTWLRTYGAGRPGRWLLVGVLVGVAALMRWQLVTFALLPAGECLFACRRAGRLAWGPVLGLALAGVGAAAAFLPQLLAWHGVYGAWLPAPVATAHNWLRPSWWQVLASSDRSLFYWTPLTLLALVGFAAGLRRAAAGAAGGPFGEMAGRGVPRLCQPCATSHTADTAVAHPDRTSHFLASAGAAGAGKGEPLVLLLAAFVVQAYVVASLWGAEVQLGVSFGLRHLTESAVVLGPGLALLLARAGPTQFRALCGLGCLLVLWNLLLICQYRYGLVPAAAGASPGCLLANAARLVVRKKSLVATQAVLGPALLWLLAGRHIRHCGSSPTPAPERVPVEERPIQPDRPVEPKNLLSPNGLL